MDLATTPLYVRAGAIVPMGPVKQYTSEPVDGPLTITVYPGADGAFELFEDDGTSLEYKRGGWMGTALAWSDRDRRLTPRARPRVENASAARARRRSPGRRATHRPPRHLLGPAGSVTLDPVDPVY